MIPGLIAALQSMFTAKSMEEQRKIFKVVDSKLWSPFFERALSSPLALSFMNGVPKPQQKLLEKEGGVSVFLRKVFEWLMTESFLRENYFYKVYVDGEYSRECCPEYLKEHNFYKLKNGLVDCISVHTTTITEFLDNYPERDITRFVLLDHMDWFSENPKMLQEEWQAIVDHSADHTRYLWRSASEKATFVTYTPIKLD
jgi:S-adenosylmethionine-diacylglycerol 3-amino-3-carboxypropyl transferase